MSEDVINVSCLTKVFSIPLERHLSVREHVAGFFRRVGVRILKALDDITFSVKAGEFVGVIGPNGSGKSTLMKVLAGIYLQNKGTLAVRGTIAPLLELGIGFNEELTARDNIIVNGTIMGISRSFLRKSSDEILDYGGLSDFGSMKVKNFSSGMRSRLAFAVASRVDADIYLMDEVMAVGDFAFKAKCIARLEELKAQGKTIILVSHDLESVKQHSNRCLYFDQGRIVLDSTPEECIARYKAAH